MGGSGVVERGTQTGCRSRRASEGRASRRKKKRKRKISCGEIFILSRSSSLAPLSCRIEICLLTVRLAFTDWYDFLYRVPIGIPIY